MKINILMSLLLSVVITAAINITYNIQIFAANVVINLISFGILFYIINGQTVLLSTKNKTVLKQIEIIQNQVTSIDQKMMNFITDSNKVILSLDEGFAESNRLIRTIDQSIEALNGGLIESIQEIATVNQKHYEIVRVNFVENTEKIENSIQSSTLKLMQSLDLINKQNIQSQYLADSNYAHIIENCKENLSTLNCLLDATKSFSESVGVYLIDSRITSEKYLELTSEQSIRIKKILDKDNQGEIVNSLQEVIDSLYDQKGLIEKNSETINENNNLLLEKYAALWKDISVEMKDASCRHQELLGLLKSHYKVLQQVVSEM